jgi:hypothetical protein
MDERKFAEGFPKFMWMPPRDVAKVGVDVLDGDRGSVIAGLSSQVSTQLFQLIPNRFLMPLLIKQHPALKNRGQSTFGQGHIEPSTGNAIALHSVQTVRARRRQPAVQKQAARAPADARYAQRRGVSGRC